MSFRAASVGCLFTLACCGASAFAGVPVAPAGFAVDQLAPQLDGVAPRIEAVRNPAYGSGVMTASIANGILTVRRISQGNIETFAVVPGFQNFVVFDLRFDVTGNFGNALFVSIHGPTVTSGVNTIISFAPSGAHTIVGSIGSPSDELAMRLDFTNGAGGYVTGAYLNDGNGNEGSSMWTLAAPATFNRIAQNSLPSGRGDVDATGMEFDQSGAFGGGLFISECDGNQSGLGAIFRVSPALTWTAFTPQTNFNTRWFRDLAISPGGAFGQFIYVTEAVGDAVGRVAPDGTYSVFATGFDIPSAYDNEPGSGGAASISVSETGNTLYLSDIQGVWRIRASGSVPGPQIIAQEPTSSGGVTLCGPRGISSVKVIFNEPVVFVPADVVVTNGAAQTVPIAVSGSGSAIMLIVFGTPLFDDTYTITLNDTIRSLATNAALDGDRDGIAGADAVLTLAHAGECGGSSCCPGDANQDGLVTFGDITSVLANFGTMCMP
jgi:hypothetical protein